MGLWETTVRFNSAAISILEGWPTINILTIPLPPSLQRYDIFIESGRACFTYFFFFFLLLLPRTFPISWLFIISINNSFVDSKVYVYRIIFLSLLYNPVRVFFSKKLGQ